MKKIFLFLLLLPLFSSGQIIRTIAGSASTTSGGDGGPATVAGIDEPGGVAYDASGNLYVSEYYMGNIRKVTPSGTITKIAGTSIPGYSGDGGPATNAQLSKPSKIAIDASGNLYFADLANNRIRKITPSGIISTVAGNGTPAYGGDGGQATAATLNNPTGVAFDASGNLYIADYVNCAIRKVVPSGIITTVAGTGVIGSGGDGGPATAAQLYQPWGVNFDAANNMYISDMVNHKIRKVNSSGIISTVAGTGMPGFSGDGGPATAAMLYQPSAVAFDSSGNMYIADELNNRVRKVSVTGIITTVAGNGTAGFSGDGGLATATELNSCNDIKFDNSGHLVINDNSNYRVRIVLSCMNYITSEPVNDTVIAGATAKYSVTTTVPTPSYQWQEDPGTGFVDLANVWPYSGVTTDTLTIHNTAIYLNATHYRCVISSGDYCTDTSSSAILIVHSNAGIAQLAGEQFNVYPNPAHDEITIQLGSMSNNGTLELFNAIGQLVLTQKIDKNYARISLSNLPPGMYLLKFDTDGQIARRKILKN